VGTSHGSAAKALGPSWPPPTTATPTDMAVTILLRYLLRTPSVAVSGHTSPQTPNGVGAVTCVQLLGNGHLLKPGGPSAGARSPWQTGTREVKPFTGTFFAVAPPARDQYTGTLGSTVLAQAVMPPPRWRAVEKPDCLSRASASAERAPLLQ
jgi:hypothetical protein